MERDDVIPLLISATVEAVLGLIGSRFLFVGSALSLVPWGIAGLLCKLVLGQKPSNSNNVLNKQYHAIDIIRKMVKEASYEEKMIVWKFGKLT